MTTVTLKQLSEEIKDMKGTLNRLVHLIEEDFALNESTKKELAEAREEQLSEYVDHEDVLKEFA